MNASLKDIEAQARRLSVEERAALAQPLLESLHEPIADFESAWVQEIERRVAAYDNGETKTYLSEDVFAEARRLSR